MLHNKLQNQNQPAAPRELRNHLHMPTSALAKLLTLAAAVTTALGKSAAVAQSWDGLYADTSG